MNQGKKNGLNGGKWTESKWLVISLPAYNEIKLNIVERNLKE